MKRLFACAVLAASATIVGCAVQTDPTSEATDKQAEAARRTSPPGGGGGGTGVQTRFPTCSAHRDWTSYDLAGRTRTIKWSEGIRTEFYAAFAAGTSCPTIRYADPIYVNDVPTGGYNWFTVDPKTAFAVAPAGCTYNGATKKFANYTDAQFYCPIDELGVAWSVADFSFDGNGGTTCVGCTMSPPPKTP